MNTDAADAQEAEHCAGCGIAEVDINLNTCNNCDVRYCSVKCQRDNISQHLQSCQKRAAELRDELLFKQPESSHLGDCPICCLPLSLDKQKSSLTACCSKIVCNGCNYANQKREFERRLQRKCPFCRSPLPDSQEEIKINYMKRMEANDPFAMVHVGALRSEEGDYKGAFKYWTKAAALGNTDAHYALSNLYRLGEGFVKDEKKMLYHLEQAAIGGRPDARFELGLYEGKNGRFDRAARHFIIAAKLGHNQSLDNLKRFYRDGFVRKEDFATALRAHQAAVDATKSQLREEAEGAKRR